LNEYPFLLLILAAVLDIIANLLLQKSNAFRRPQFGIPAIIMVCMAFSLLAKATEVMDLTVAYVSWGAMAIMGTVVSARILLGQKLNRFGWAGIIMILTSIVLMKTA
jgi:spermidine export protein MdtI